MIFTIKSRVWIRDFLTVANLSNGEFYIIAPFWVVYEDTASFGDGNAGRHRIMESKYLFKLTCRFLDRCIRR